MIQDASCREADTSNVKVMDKEQRRALPRHRDTLRCSGENKETSLGFY